MKKKYALLATAILSGSIYTGCSKDIIAETEPASAVDSTVLIEDFENSSSTSSNIISSYSNNESGDQSQLTQSFRESQEERFLNGTSGFMVENVD